MKQLNLGIGEKSIDTPSLFLEKNIMMWNNHTMIQLSNISYISAEGIPSLPFPIFSILFLFLGLCFLVIPKMGCIGILLLIATGWYLYFWYEESKKRQNGAILNIRMNSGHVFNFEFSDKAFLQTVATRLKLILMDGGVSGKVEISIKDCVIKDSNVLTGANIK